MITAVLSHPDHNHKLVLLSLEPDDTLDDGDFIHVDLTEQMDAEVILMRGGQKALQRWLDEHNLEGG